MSDRIWNLVQYSGTARGMVRGQTTGGVIGEAYRQHAMASLRGEMADEATWHEILDEVYRLRMAANSMTCDYCGEPIEAPAYRPYSAIPLHRRCWNVAHGAKR